MSVVKREFNVQVVVICDACKRNQITITQPSGTSPEEVKAAIAKIDHYLQAETLHNELTGQIWLASRGKHYCSACRQFLQRAVAIGAI